MRFRTRSQEVEAVQWTGDNLEEVRAFIGEGRDFSNDPLGDWIIKGVQGEFYPCKPDIFALTYEPARPECGCFQCWEGWAHSFDPPKHLDRMLTCDECGNKRCPHATDHNNPCTRSNDPGQEGSRYGEVSS